MNRYLDPMSAEILGEKGTIDKFEGDAIIAFFGAPIRFEDHATRACRAAVQMKKLESDLSSVLMEENLTPSPLKTRIGLNSGGAVIGNMGTEKKMNYTMMGNTVNLAARLEGVNKQYGTWILMSQQTYDQTGRTFSVRKLDRVRVVGIDEPVRLYELIDLRENVDGDEDLIGKLRMFNSGLTAFEEKNWEGARKLFKEVLDKYPEDGPARRYLDLCVKFKKSAPSADWDGVFNLTSK
jgi:adenylate cyclase